MALFSGPNGQIIAQQASTAQAAAGNSGDLVVSIYDNVIVDINVTAFTGGTSPTVAFIMERKGADGIYYAIYSPTALSAAGSISQTVGKAIAVSSGATTVLGLGDVIRLRWAYTGTPTSVTFSYSIKSS